MASHPLVRAFIFSALPLACVISPTLVFGQVFSPRQDAQSGRFIEAPRSIQQQLREAERAIDEQRYSDAVVRLGDLLAVENENSDDADLAGQDFFLEIDDSRADGVPINSSLLRAARQMIGTLSAEAMETYELRYGPLARKLLTEAAQSRDWEQVREVRRKYFHTTAGFEASALLAQHEIYEGHPLAASILLDDVVSVPRAVDHLGKGIVLLHASASKLGGRELAASNVKGGGDVVVGGRSETFPGPNEISGWLAERVSVMDGFSGGDPLDYPVFGGGPSRNGTSAGQMPLTNLRWKLNTSASPRQERNVRKAAEELTTSGKLPPPSWTPLRVGNQLLMRTTERLVGVDYRTGKRIWTYPWQSSSETFDQDETSLDVISGEYGSSDLLSQRVWNDLPYGQVTSDGTRVFMLDDLREVEMASYNGGMINLRGTRPADTRTNTLVALDLETEGKLLWLLGAGADQESGLSDAFFLGPPLPLDGRLYVMVEIAGDINVCCLDPATGNELWRQQVVAVESGGIDSDPIRRVAGATPTYHEGLLICPTGAGAIVAIDLADRMLRWGVNYDRNMEMVRNVLGRGRALEPLQLMQRWYSGAAIANKNALLVTPIEANRLYGFNLLTGERLFPNIKREQMRYLAGVRDGRFYVVGASQVRAYDLNSGNELWTTPRDLLSAGQQICGWGMFGKNEYMIPTTSNQVVSISLKDGTVTDRRNTRFPLGNLVAVGGEIIAQGPTTLAVAFGETTLEPIVNRMLEKDPNDFEALVRKSELLIQRGQRDEALELLTRARGMEPDNDEVRMLSVAAMLGSLRETLSADSDLVETLDRLIDRPSQRVELLSLRIRAALAGKEYQQAAKHLIDLSSLVVAEPLLESSADEVVNDSSRHCSLDGWLAARVQEIVDDASEADLRKVDQMVRDANVTKQQGSTNLLRRIVKHFGSVEGIEALRRELTERMQADVAYLELERLALATQIPSSLGLSSLSTERLMMLAEAYAMGGLAKDANVVLDVLDTRELSSRDRVEQLRKRAESQIAEPQWPRKVSLNWDSRLTRIRAFDVSQRVAETTVLAGKSFEGWRLVSESRSPLALRDPTGLRRTIQAEGFSEQQIDKEAQICGGVMVVVMPDGLVGIDLYHLLSGNGESVLWRRGLSGDSGPVAKRGSAMNPFDDRVIRYNMALSTASNLIPEFKLGPIMGDRVLLLQGGDLLAIDLYTAETIWRNSSAPQSGAVLCDGKRVAVVSSDTDKVAFFDLLDGRMLESEAWEHGKIWESIGSNVLAYHETDRKGRYELRIVNVFTGEVILRHETNSVNRSSSNVPSACGQIVDGRYMTLLESTGQALIWDVMEGREIGRPLLPEYPNLQGLKAMYLEGQIVLLPKRRVEPALKQNQQLQTEQGSVHHRVDGVHAVSLEDGSLRWSKQFDKPWGCTLTQPSETPILILSRSPFTHEIQRRKKSLDVLALDVRDGIELSERLDKEIMSNNNQLETRLTIQPALSRVIAQIGPELLTYTFGEVAEDKSEVDPPADE